MRWNNNRIKHGHNSTPHLVWRALPSKFHTSNRCLNRNRSHLEKNQETRASRTEKKGEHLRFGRGGRLVVFCGLRNRRSFRVTRAWGKLSKVASSSSFTIILGLHALNKNKLISCSTIKTSDKCKVWKFGIYRYYMKKIPQWLSAVLLKWWLVYR